MEANDDRLAEVAGLLQQALCAGLMGAEWAAAKGFRWLAEAYNGIGPEFFGEDLRKKTSRWFAIFKPAALIHDGRNHVSDGTRKNFDLANIEFRFNCFILADRAYPWWNWKRYRARLVADALYDFVSSPAGWKAWLEAHEARAQRISQDRQDTHDTQDDSSPRPGGPGCPGGPGTPQTKGTNR